MDDINQYDCICTDGYTGEYYSVNIDNCLPQPCMNNGTCSDTVNGFNCTCITGYTVLVICVKLTLMIVILTA